MARMSSRRAFIDFARSSPVVPDRFKAPDRQANGLEPGTTACGLFQSFGFETRAPRPAICARAAARVASSHRHSNRLPTLSDYPDRGEVTDPPNRPVHGIVTVLFISVGKAIHEYRLRRTHSISYLRAAGRLCLASRVHFINTPGRPVDRFPDLEVKHARVQKADRSSSGLRASCKIAPD